MLSWPTKRSIPGNAEQNHFFLGLQIPTQAFEGYDQKVLSLGIYLVEFFFGVQELRDATDEFWIHEQRFAVAGQRKLRLTFLTCNRRLRGAADSHRAFRMSHFSLKYFQARFRPWGFLPTWMMTSMTSCSGTRSEVRDRFSNLGHTETDGDVTGWL